MPRPREKGPVFWRYTIGAMLTGVFALFAVISFNVPPATDQETACRLDRKSPAHTVVLIDQSDPFGANDVDWVAELIDAEARQLPRYGRLTVLTPDAGRPYEPRQVFAACSPGSAQDANPLFQNPRMIEAEWTRTFYTPLKDRVERSMQNDRAPSSPLSEAIYAVSDRADFQATSGKRRFVIVSDLMQHSDDFSFYRTGADREAFAGSRLGRQIPEMDGVDVVTRIVPRQEYDLPIETLESFWFSYFEQTGARYASVN